ncbi:uncharacterized protein BYT42DRAFT_288293 [Radiomyces spectabilis]|uniref:uncharacterized protein n=1 Tax=Radiomyces spectabilis TaxID=64574 RepID=UPI00222091BB|nr:uncharacterized protein BYT42DRAFT_288293 [Radiomyces spectabilis]KAI8380996.1 hypothetical protein BYT42DRAFT_288293 [Radiomyces spectabilis]
MMTPVSAFPNYLANILFSGLLVLSFHSVLFLLPELCFPALLQYLYLYLFLFKPGSLAVTRSDYFLLFFPLASSHFNTLHHARPFFALSNRLKTLQQLFVFSHLVTFPVVLPFVFIFSFSSLNQIAPIVTHSGDDRLYYFILKRYYTYTTIV